MIMKREKLSLTIRTPQAYPSLGTSDLSRLATMYASLISDHFIPSVPPLPILPPTK